MLDGATTGGAKALRGASYANCGTALQNAPISPGSRDGIGAPSEQPSRFWNKGGQSMKRGETFLPDGFGLSDSTYAWLRETHPTVHVADTFAIFVDKALAKGWRYRDWNAAFRNYVRNGKQYGGVTYRELTKEEDPKWQIPLNEGRKVGFRKPHPHESVAGYRTALQMYVDEPEQRRSVLNGRAVLKLVPR